MITPTLALDQILRHPDFPRLVERLRANAPTAQLDQRDAAASEAQALIHAVAAARNDPVVGMATADTPDWLPLGAVDALVAHCTGSATTCLHSPDPRRPQPVVAAAWCPGRVVCCACTRLLSLPSAGAADRTCDACGRICAGIEVGDGIYPSALALGSLTYLFGSCRECRPAELAAVAA